MKRSRLLTVAAPLVLLATLLTGCSSGGGGSATGDVTVDASGNDCAASGSVSNAVKADGGLGDAVTLEAKTPLKTDSLQRTVLIDGDGTAIAAGADANVSFTVFNGKTGETINHIPTQVLKNDEQQLASDKWAYEAVRCGSLGQRVAMVVPAWEAIGGDPAQAGITGMEKDDTFVFVIDFVKPFVEFGDCETVKPYDPAYPQVDLKDGKSEPVITIPECMAAPEGVQVKVLVEGDGPVVEANQKIMTNYLGAEWNGAKKFQANWTDTGIPFDTTPGALIDGFSQAMIGNKIGSTILVSVPAENGYGVGTGAPLADRTLVFVLQMVSAG